MTNQTPALLVKRAPLVNASCSDAITVHLFFSHLSPYRYNPRSPPPQYIWKSRWPPSTVRCAISRRSHENMGDCEQSKKCPEIYVRLRFVLCPVERAPILGSAVFEHWRAKGHSINSDNIKYKLLKITPSNIASWRTSLLNKQKSFLNKEKGLELQGIYISILTTKQQSH